MITLVKTLDADTYNVHHRDATMLGDWLGGLAGREAGLASMFEAPTLDLSGEWADGETSRTVLDRIRTLSKGTRLEIGELHPEDADALVDAFETAWNDAARDVFTGARRLPAQR
jgi:hypothetical protein